MFPHPGECIESDMGKFIWILRKLQGGLEIYTAKLYSQRYFAKAC
jgi:hypothetical protein